MNGVFENHCGPVIISFGSMVELSFVFCARLVRTPPVWQKDPTRHLHWLCVTCPEASGKRDMTGTDVEELEQ